MNNTTEPLPPSSRFDFSPLEQVAQLDMVGSMLSAALTGKPVGLEQMMATMTLLRLVRDDIAVRNNLGAESQYSTAAYQAEVEMRRMMSDGTFDLANGEKGA